MKIVVLGIGGVGGYFGGKLVEADEDVTFVARGKHYAAIKNSGLKINSVNGDFHVHPKVVSAVSEIDQADLIILGVKSWQVQDVAKQIIPLVSEATMVLPLQNGADNADKLRNILPHHNVLAGLCLIVSRIEAPGVIDHFAFDPEIVFGEYDNTKTERIENIHKVFNKAGFNNRISEDIHLDIWKKFLYITTVSGIGAITRSVFGDIRENKGVRRIMMDTANEIVAIANAKGIGLNQDHINMILNVFDNQLHNTTASMQRDLMAGRPSELDVFNGYVVKEGKRLNIPTPANAFIYHCLTPQEQKARKQL